MSETSAPPPVVASAISAETWTAAELAASFLPDPLQPFAPIGLDFCASLSQDLLSAPGVRAHPQVVALAYWLRPAGIRRVADAFHARKDERTILVPRGRAFHVTPANVDTMFVYSFVLSLLAGNTNVVHVSERRSPAIALLLDVLGRLLARPEWRAQRRRHRFVHLGHDDEAARALSAAADVRILWGGDETVEHFRGLPLKPRGRDVAFPDRHSFAILGVRAVLDADEARLCALAAAFFNDAYWFDQAACASPRLVIWDDPGGASDAEAARARFRRALAATVTARGYRVETGAAIEKMAFAMRAAADGRATRLQRESNEILWLEIDDLRSYSRAHCGGGAFFDLVSKDLEADLLAFLDDRDQTAACYGLDGSRVRALAARLNGRGVDRFVSVGCALEFAPVWDGLDLLQELTKKVVVDVAARADPGASP